MHNKALIVAIVALLASVLVIWGWFPPAMKAGGALGIKHQVSINGLSQSYYETGAGPLVIMLPSLGRPASDFNALAVKLNGSGYRTLAFDPPHRVQKSEAPYDLFSIADLVGKAAAEREQGDHAPVILIGHAFGNRVARAYATRYPEQVRALVLLAAGGRKPITPPVLKALKRCFDPRLPRWKRTAALHTAFFAQGNAIPAHWRVGWDRHAAALQGNATAITPSKYWWAGGDAPMLVIQGDADAIAPAADTSVLLTAEYGSRVQVVTASPAWHALLPEQPDFIANAVLAYLHALPE